MILNFFISKLNYHNLINTFLCYSIDNINKTIYNDYYFKNNNIDLIYEYRIKKKAKIIKKINQERIPYDLIGIRIIYNDKNNLYNKEYAYKLKQIIEENYLTIDSLQDDYIKNPKKNNYQSIHIYIFFIFLIEIQIRSSYMNYIAVNGTASDYYIN
jgi:(p)ppGpp synthase/HD superfamily hydrolase